MKGKLAPTKSLRMKTKYLPNHNNIGILLAKWPE